ncbi:uncharacterized protein FIBRA_05748 [Fibroporia radiculosa]|uniref:Glucose-methanol-choline oxidoreductase N-terminal domain-containing protein n=1 Tax=Fibroporia radiculosa TaxID=599839 RepID=J4GRJ5_9APHY|nr:uncharacterized protein FIBRA_05748 [Fibroporia radiculosa]CCM03610.1 predicted protein [Fibroporia radiculosa]
MPFMIVGSAINAMIFHHGAPSDFDQWAEYQKGQKGAEGWTYKEFNRYFLKFEKFHPSKTYGPTDLTSRSFTGPVNVGYFSHTAASTKVFLEACSNAGVSPNPDFNTSRGTLGVNKVCSSRSEFGVGALIDFRVPDPVKRRVTTESSYLTPSALARPNLKVATKARVARIIFDNTSNGSGLRAVGVQYTNAGELYEVRARKEVIVSAGALHTPHVLMLSGIGPADHLASHNIPVLVDLPGVGSHLMDHPVIDFHYKDKSRALLSGISSGNPRFNPTPYNIFIALALLIQYKLTGRGLLTTNPAESAGFVRSSDPKLFPPNDFPIEEDIEDTTSGPGAPDIEFFHTPVAYMEHGIRMFPKGHYFALHAVLLRPTSKGTVRLISSDPSDEPVLDPEYLSTKHDIDVLVRATRLVTRIARTEPFASLIDPSGDTDPLLDHGLHLASDERIVEFIRDRVETLYHPACSARMAPLEDGGVVDPFLRVHGIPNLRVVDASAFPTITSGHTASPVIAMAEKAADMIKDAIKSK